MRDEQRSTDDVTVDASRIIHLDGAVNIRDLGGLSTSDGRTVRRGRIFRSDGLYRLTPGDVIALRSLGIRTVIDLRSRREVEHYPQSALIAAGIRHTNVPVVVDPPVAAPRCWRTISCFSAMPERHSGRSSNTWHVMCIPSSSTAFAGKDRTGLASALILGALGVPDDVIVADYALSERHMVRHLNLHRASDDVPDHTGPLPDWLVAEPVTMAMTLGAMADAWGRYAGT